MNNEPTGGAFWEHRRIFLDPIVAAATQANKQLLVFEYQGPWMHSKSWVFDDKYAIIGSANVNRRGYTHDSEQACGIFNTNGRSKKGWFLAHELRMNLWAKHLGGPPISYRDPVAGLGLWRVSKTVSPYNRKFDEDQLKSNHPQPVNKDSPLILSIWDSSFDPDGS